MARIRTIKPEFWQDERLGALPIPVRLLFIGLWNLADDDGRLRGNPRLIKGQVFPYDSDQEVAVPAGLDHLEKAGRIRRYVHCGESFVWIPKFRDHQRIDKPKASVLPPPPPEPPAGLVQDESTTHPGCVQDESRQEGKGMEGKGKEGNGGELPPPLGFSVVPPTTDPETWLGQDFWTWAQSRRVASGFLAEGKPNPSKLNGWWASARMTEGVTASALQEGFYRFGDDKHWESKDPPYPFAAFMSQWTKYTRPEAVHGSHP